MKDLTKGFPAKVILLFAIPIICGSIFQQFYNIADSKIVSTFVGTRAFAAVGATSVVSNTLIGFLNSLTLGFAIPIANCFGSKDFSRMRKNVAGTIILTATMTVILTSILLLLIPKILVLLDTPADIMDDALSYVRIILAGTVFCSLYNMCANVLRAVGDSKTPLYCLMTSVVINIGLDLLFIKEFEMGINGAAYATVLSQAICSFLCLGYILLKFRDILPKKGEWKPEQGQYGELITTGLSMGLMSCVVNIGTIVLQSAINGLGTDYVAAHTAARKVFDIFTVSLYCIGNAMTTYTSQNMGAGRTDRVKQGVRHAVAISWTMTTVLVFVCYIFGRPLFVWLTSTDKQVIIDSAVMYCRISILFFYVLGPLFILRCTLQGMGRKVVPVCSSVMEMCIKVLSAMILVPHFKYFGVIMTEPVSWVCMTILLASAYFINPPDKYIKQSQC
ncbi:MAG: MATE family efflux transporter [Wujia sp.]